MFEMLHLLLVPHLVLPKRLFTSRLTSRLILSMHPHRVVLSGSCLLDISLQLTLEIRYVLFRLVHCMSKFGQLRFGFIQVMELGLSHKDFFSVSNRGVTVLLL